MNTNDYQHARHEARERLSALGERIDSKRFRQMEAQALADAQAHAQTQADAHTGNVKAAQFIERIFNYGTIVSVTAIVAVFVLIVFGLFAVESIATIHGLMHILPRFEATLSGLVLISSVYAVMFMRELLAANGVTDDSPTFSLRIMAHDVAYLLGIGKNWKRRTRGDNLAVTANAVLGLLIVASISLSVFGRLGPLLMSVADMNVRDGVGALAATASLVDLIASVSIILLTFSVFRASHFVMHFTFLNFTRITGGLDLGKSHASLEALANEYMLDWYTARVMTADAKAQAALPDTAQPMPTQPTAQPTHTNGHWPATNGNGNY